MIIIEVDNQYQYFSIDYPLRDGYADVGAAVPRPNGVVCMNGQGEPL